MNVKASLQTDLDRVAQMLAGLNVSFKAGYFSKQAKRHFKSAIEELEKLEGSLTAQLATFDIDDSIKKMSRGGVLSLLRDFSDTHNELNSTQAIKARLRDLVLGEHIDEVELLIVLSGE